VDRQQGEEGVEGGGQVQRLAGEERHEQHVHGDPQGPAFQALLRHPALRHQAEGGQSGVPPGTGGIGVVGHQVTERDAADQARTEPVEALRGVQAAHRAAVVVLPAAGPLPPAIEL